VLALSFPCASDQNEHGDQPTPHTIHNFCCSKRISMKGLLRVNYDVEDMEVMEGHNLWELLGMTLNKIKHGTNWSESHEAYRMN
jgi:hypothetical protein